MLDSVKEISLRTILVAALVVWGVLAVVWFLLLGWDNTVEVPASNSAGRPVQTIETESDGTTGSESFSMPPEIVVEEGDSGGRRQSAPAGPAASSPVAREGDFVLQLGAFKESQGAETRASELRARGIQVSVRPPESTGDFFRVLAGPFASKSDALSEQLRLKEAGIDSFLRKSFR